jgi:hypothetical protein
MYRKDEVTFNFIVISLGTLVKLEARSVYRKYEETFKFIVNNI